MNHLLIGLGGTGSRVLAGLRKRLLLQLGSERPAHLGLDFLLIDEGAQLSRENDPLWSVLGHSLQLPRRNRLALDLAPQALAAGLSERPALRRGLGELAQSADLPGTLVALDGGAGRRRLAHWGLSTQLGRCRDTLDTLGRELQQRSGHRRITWHLFCHLGGGVGSGLLPAMLQLLQRESRDPASRVIVYGVLPEAVATPGEASAGVDAGQARTYATLLELVALAQAGNSGGTNSGADQPGRSVDACYLNNDPQAAEALAELVFQKIAVLGPRWDLLTRLDAGRLPGATPEPSTSCASPFIGFGIARFGPDERRLLQHLADEQAIRVLNHLRYDHWRPGLGYVDQPRPAAQAGTAVDDAMRQRWGLTEAALQLQPANAGDAAAAGNSSFDAFWREYETHFAQLVAKLPESQRLAQLRSLFEQALQGGFRGQGVERHYAQADDDLFHLVDARVGGIEVELVQDWRAGRRSLHDCGRLVAALMGDLEPRGDQAAAQAEQAASAAAHHEQQLADIEQRWSGGGGGWADLTQRLSGATSARREIDLGNAATLLRERCIALTRAEACRFAQRHARRLGSRLGDLLNLIDAVELTVGSLAEQYQAQAVANLPEREVDAANDERRRIDEARQRLLAEETTQREHAAAVRDELFGILGERANFRTFALELAEDHLCQVLLARSASAVQRNLSTGTLPGLWDTLALRWQAPADRRASDLQGLAADALRGQPSSTAVPSHWGLITPDVAAPTELMQQLGTGLAEAITRVVASAGHGSAAAASVPQLASNAGHASQGDPAQTPAALQLDLLAAAASPQGRPAEQNLTLISLAPALNLADAPWLRPLHAAYEKVRLRNGLAAAALHVEGDASCLPVLVTPDQGELRAQARRLLLLAAALDLVHTSPDPAGAGMRLLQVRLDIDGFEMDRKVLGSTLADAAQTLDALALRELRQVIQEQDLARRVHEPARHDALRAAMRHHIETIRSGAPAAELDAISLAWNEAARAVMQFVRQEAPL